MEIREGRALLCTCRQGYQGFFFGLGNRAAAAGVLSHMTRGAALLQTSPQVFERFLAPSNPGRKWERYSQRKKYIENRTQIGVKLNATNKAVPLSSIATQIEPSRVA